MAAEASEIQGHVSVAMNWVRGAPREPLVLYIEEPADRRCISLETGSVKLVVRLVGVTEKRHEISGRPNACHATLVRRERRQESREALTRAGSSRL